MRPTFKHHPGDQANQARIAAAYAVHSGKAPADHGSEAPEAVAHRDDPQTEQREDQLIQTIDQSIGAAKDALEELKVIQEQEENRPANDEMAAQDSGKPMDADTGSPSAQGWP